MLAIALEPTCHRPGFHACNFLLFYILMLVKIVGNEDSRKYRSIEGEGKMNLTNVR